MDVLRQHEIAESRHRILNAFTDEKLMLLGAACSVGYGQEVLDLACGKGELLCRWAQDFGIAGLGIDISDVFLGAARARAVELGVTDRVMFQQGDAGQLTAETGSFDIVSCIGATWIGGGLTGTIQLMRQCLHPGGLLLVGEPFWREPPPEQAAAALGLGPDDFTSLTGTLDRFESAGTQLVEMVLADEDSWDRYVASQWWAVREWLRVNPDHEDAPAMRDYLEASRRSHLTYGRRYLGWGVFALRTD